MIKDSKYGKIIQKLGVEIRVNEPLAKYTTFRIGGPADLLYEAKAEEDFILAVQAALNFKIPFFILGNGSNILVSDEGFRGMVIKNGVIGMKIIGRTKESKKIGDKEKARYSAADPKKYLKASDLDYPDEPLSVKVQVYTGTPLQKFIKWSLDNRLTGLQWFAGIPGTIGGAVVNNIHGYTRLFSDYIESLDVIGHNGKLIKIRGDEARFGYDFSNLSKDYLGVVSVIILMAEGDVNRAKFVYHEWWKRKLKVQPQKNCPGSIFKNVSEEEVKRVGAPTPSAGWFIDQCGFKGKTVGGAAVSELHANFIVNKGNATAADVAELVRLIKKKVKDKFGISLEEEIKFVGFDKIC
jgi:UDP-N-acetylmuramate dehydrogenase